MDLTISSHDTRRERVAYHIVIGLLIPLVFGFSGKEMYAAGYGSSGSSPISKAIDYYGSYFSKKDGKIRLSTCFPPADQLQESLPRWSNEVPSKLPVSSP
jgi:hypothetical protein